MMNSSNWFGNVSEMIETMDEDGVLTKYITPKFIEMTPLALTMYVKNVFRAQQTRSYQISLVEKEDIWDSKNTFRNEVRKIILQENLQTVNINELV